MNIFHFSLHQACSKEIRYIASRTNSMCHTWEPILKKTHYYKQSKDAADLFFDHVYPALPCNIDTLLFSDTSPLSRGFLQNLSSHDKRIIVWSNNRFDHAIEGDQHWYDLVRSTYDNDRVKYIAYTRYEKFYSQMRLGLDIYSHLITPTGLYSADSRNRHIQENNKFFTTTYSNDMYFRKQLFRDDAIDIDSFVYSSIDELLPYRAILHFPYAWSNYALFENSAVNNKYIIPSLRFLADLIVANKNQYWFSQLPSFKKYRRLRMHFSSRSRIMKMLQLSEWYGSNYFRENITYYDSFGELFDLLSSFGKKTSSQIAPAYSEHCEEQLDLWKQVLFRW